MSVRRDAVEVELGLLAGLVHRRQRRAGEAGGVAVDREERLPPAPVLGGDERCRSAVWPSITNIFVPVSVQPSPSLVAVASMPVSSHLPFGSVKASVAIVSPEAMPGRQRRLGGVVAGVEERVGGEHDGREVRGAQQGAAHLLEHDAELDEGEALAAELLGDDAGSGGRARSAICVQTAGS